MNNQVYLISKCLGKLKKKDHYKFHFIGFYKGGKIKKIIVRTKGFEFEKNEEYVLKLMSMHSLEGVLYTNLIKARKLFYIN